MTIEVYVPINVTLDAISGSARIESDVTFSNRAAIEYCSRTATLRLELFSLGRILYFDQVPVEPLICAALAQDWLQAVAGCKTTRQFTPPDGRRPWINFENEHRSTAFVLELVRAELTLGQLPVFELTDIGTLDLKIIDDCLKIIGKFDPDHQLCIRVDSAELLMSLTRINCLKPVSWNYSTQQVVVQLPRCAR